MSKVKCKPLKKYYGKLSTCHILHILGLNWTSDTNLCSYQTWLSLITVVPQGFLISNQILSITQSSEEKEARVLSIPSPLLFFCKRQSASIHCHLWPLNDQHHAAEKPCQRHQRDTCTLWNMIHLVSDQERKSKEGEGNL